MIKKRRDRILRRAILLIMVLIKDKNQCIKEQGNTVIKELREMSENKCGDCVYEKQCETEKNLKYWEITLEQQISIKPCIWGSGWNRDNFKKKHK